MNITSKHLRPSRSSGLIAVLSAGLMLGLASCGQAEAVDIDRATASSPSASELVATRVVDRTTIEATDLPPTDAEIAIADFNAAIDRRLELCMERAGFPELKEMTELRPGDGAQRSLLSWNPYESGPITQEVALAYGFLGMGELFQDTSQPELLGDRGAFDSAFDRCAFELDRIVPGSYQAKMAELSEFSTSLRREYVDSLTPTITELVGEMTTCLQRSDSRTPDTIDDFDQLLAAHGIEPGTVVPRPESAVVETDGLDVQLMAAEQYVPSEAEQELALVYAECADQIELVKRVESVQIEARPRFLERHQAELQDWVEWSNQATAQVSAAE